MSPREVVAPTQTGDEETHPAFGMIGVSRRQCAPGSVLFDSDIQHRTTMAVRISTASRRRHLKSDWLHSEQEFMEIEMSQSQWASFVASAGVGGGVPCTIRRREDNIIPDIPLEPRLATSIGEVRGAAEEAFEHIKETFEAYTKTKRVAELRALRSAIENAASNVEFAGQSLTEHAENVIEKARADVESFVASAAERRGLDPGDLESAPQLMAPDDEEKR